MSLESRLADLEAEIFCVVNTTEDGHVYETGCGESGHYEDWGDKDRCPYCGKKLKGHKEC